MSIGARAESSQRDSSSCWCRPSRSVLEGHTEEGRAAIARLQSFTTFSDPEGLFYWAHVAAGLGDHDTALDLLSRAVDTGFYCVRGFEISPLLTVLRPFPAFDAILLERARVRQQAAAKAFVDADGPRLLGLPAIRTESHAIAQEYPPRQKCVRAAQSCCAAWPRLRTVQHA